MDHRCVQKFRLQMGKIGTFALTNTGHVYNVQFFPIVIAFQILFHQISPDVEMIRRLQIETLGITNYRINR